MRLQIKYKDKMGFEYKSARSKTSKVKSYIDPNRIEKKVLAPVETATGFEYDGQDYRITYNKENGDFRLALKVTKEFDKYGRGNKTTELFRVKGITLSFETFKDFAIAYK